MQVRRDICKINDGSFIFQNTICMCGRQSASNDMRSLKIQDITDHCVSRKVRKADEIDLTALIKHRMLYP